jgi:predicted DNA binding CopG/RHH family protein
MKPTQVTEIIAIVKRYLTLEKNGGFITLRIKETDLNAVKTEIGGVLK